MALNSATYTVGTAAIKILGAQSNPTQVILHNMVKSSNEYIYLGGSADITINNSIHLDDGDDYQFVLQPGNELWAISDSNRTLGVMWQVL